MCTCPKSSYLDPTNNACVPCKKEFLCDACDYDSTKPDQHRCVTCMIAGTTVDASTGKCPCSTGTVFSPLINWCIPCPSQCATCI